MHARACEPLLRIHLLYQRPAIAANLAAQFLGRMGHRPLGFAKTAAVLHFQRAGQFPVTSDPEFPFSEEARRVYRSGAPFLQRYVPFWVASTIDRLIVSLVVVLPILIPLVRFAPQIYSWRIRRRIVYWYGALKGLEAAARKAGGPEARAEHLLELDRIEAAVDEIPVPLAFSDKLYELRQHIEVVRRRLAAGIGHAGVAAGAT